MTDEQLNEIEVRADCVTRAQSIEDYHRRWREFEQHALDDVHALLAEVRRLRGGEAQARTAAG